MRLEEILHDLQFALRSLRRSPGFTLTVVLTLGLAIGASTAIFSIVNSVLLRPLPFAEPDALVQVFARSWAEDRPGEPTLIAGPVGSPQLLSFIDESTLATGFVGYAVTTSHLSDGDSVERLNAVRADADVFTVLGTAPLLGRPFDRNDPADVAVISADLWRRRFGGATSLPGTRVRLDDRTVTIVGVMPAAFQFPYGSSATLAGALPETRTDVWMPIEPVRTAATPDGLRRGRVHVIARLKDGVSPGSAEAELRTISARLEARQSGATRLRFDARVVSLRDEVLGPVSRSLWLLLAAAGLVLTAACANVANLLVARLTVRLREVATRAALGATRGRLARLFLVESLALSLGGAIVGVTVAHWGAGLFAALAAPKIPRAHEIAVDWRAFVFLLSACLATAMLFGVAPALAAARVDARGAAGDAARGATVGRGLRRLRDALVVSEVALAFVLATGAAWVIHEGLRLREVDVGMNPANVVTLHLTPRATAREYYAIEQRVGALPGVESAGLTQLLPLQNWGWEAEFAIEGRAPGAGRQIAGLRYVTPGYFRTLQIPLLRGRPFALTDVADSPRVLLVNDALARRYFPGEDPVGRELDRGTIVGVVGDVRQVALGLPAEPELYYVAAQNVTMASDLGMSLVVRTASTEAPVMPAIRSAIADVSPRLAIFREKTMARVVEDSLWELNLYVRLIGAFAVLVLLLAAIGLYGVIAYSAGARSREFAIRLALGSNRLSLARVVLLFGAKLTIAGLLVGAMVTAVVTVAAGELPSTIGLGPVALVSAAAAIVVLTLAASAAPVIRVARIDPAAALRHE